MATQRRVLLPLQTDLPTRPEGAEYVLELVYEPNYPVNEAVQAVYNAVMALSQTGLGRRLHGDQWTWAEVVTHIGVLKKHRPHWVKSLTVLINEPVTIWPMEISEVLA